MILYDKVRVSLAFKFQTAILFSCRKRIFTFQLYSENFCLINMVLLNHGVNEEERRGFFPEDEGFSGAGKKKTRAKIQAF